MKRKIFSAIAGLSTVVLLTSAIIISLISYSYFSDLESRELKTQLVLASEGVESGGKEYLQRIDYNDCRLTLVDKNGVVTFDNLADISKMTNHLDREEIKEAMETGDGESVRYSVTYDKQTMYYATRLTDGSVLRVSVTRRSFFQMILRELAPIIAVLALALGTALFMAQRLAKSIVEPINGIDLNHPMENRTYEEFVPLLQKLKYYIEQKEDAEQMRREFSANVSHELKTPIQSIMGSGELLAEGLVPYEDVQNFGERIRFESARLVDLIEDILRLSKLDEGIEYEVERINLHELASNVIGGLTDKANRYDVSLNLEGDEIFARGVPSLVYEMLYNVVDNAIKYNRAHGSVVVKLSSEDNRSTVKVIDTGIGIPPEDQPRVFERFYRVDKSHSRSTGGTGLGLSIVKHAAANQNVDLSLESSEDGTTITFVFPPYINS